MVEPNTARRMSLSEPETGWFGRKMGRKFASDQATDGGQLPNSPCFQRVEAATAARHAGYDGDKLNRASANATRHSSPETGYRFKKRFATCAAIPARAARAAGLLRTPPPPAPPRI